MSPTTTAKHRCLRALIAVIGILMSPPATAHIYWGVRGGINMTELSFGREMLNVNSHRAYFIGPTALVTVPILGVGIDASLFFEHSRTQVTPSGETPTTTDNAAITSIDQNRLLLPFNIRINFGLGTKASLFVFGGPQYAFNVGRSVRDLQMSDLNDVIHFRTHASSTAVNLGIGLMAFSHLQIAAQYTIPLDAGTSTWTDTAQQVIKADNKTVQLSAAIYF